LVRINGVLREIPIGERVTDGKKVYLGGSADITYFPRYEDKEDLLLQTLE